VEQFTHKHWYTEAMSNQKSNKLRTFITWEVIALIGASIYCLVNQLSMQELTALFIGGQILVIFFTFYPIPDSKYGVGEKYPSKETLDRVKLIKDTPENRNEAWNDSTKYMIWFASFLFAICLAWICVVLVFSLISNIL
jgi:hypothetical protein